MMPRAFKSFPVIAVPLFLAALISPALADEITFSRGVAAIGITTPPATEADIIGLQSKTQSNKSNFCPPVPIHICGNRLVPRVGRLGTILSLTLPEWFEERTIVVQCVSGANGRLYYQMMPGVNAPCTLKKCNSGEVKICDRVIPFNRQSQYGDVVEVKVPETLLVAGQGLSEQKFTARCTMVDGTAQYEPVETSGVSCNAFVCQPSELNICGSTVSVSKTAKLGEVFQMNTASGLPVTVRCLGSNGNAPKFTITDHLCGR